MAQIVRDGYNGLIDTRGNPLRSSVAFKKDKPPALGPSYGNWSGSRAGDVGWQAFMSSLGVVQFDLSQLTLQDFRNMRDHSQVYASLSVLAFMQHQSVWEIKCENKKIADMLTEQMDALWTQLNRAMSQANWAGYSPCVLEYENDVQGKQVVLSKIKDLVPENCVVNWKEVPGKKLTPDSVPPKLQVYDGIRQFGQAGPILAENTFWYPILMENGNYYGSKLLRPAFTPWYFSLLIHVYANRYYERYGEPTPIGRASFEDTMTDGTATMPGNQWMLKVLSDLRSRAVVVLPNDGVEDASGKFRYDYNIDFLESQMRGADFERYLNRLDEEISLGMFTPVLLMRTADVGSYNLGQGHMQMFLWIMNGMNADRAFYINKYILAPLVRYNFGPNAPRATIEFRKLGDENLGTVKEILTALVNHGIAMPDLEELGEMAGMTIKDIRATLAPSTADPSSEPDQQNPGNSDKTGDNAASSGSSSSSKSDKNGDTKARRASLHQAIVTRVRPQVVKAYRNDNFVVDLSLGHTRELASILTEEGVPNARTRAYTAISAATEAVEYELWDSGPGGTVEDFMNKFEGDLGRYLENA